MSFALLIIDMQKGETKRLRDPKKYDRDLLPVLCKTICDMRQKLKSLGIPIFHVAYVNNPPVIGTLDEVNKEIQEVQGIDLLSGSNRAFDFPVEPREWVIIKNKCSAALPEVIHHFHKMNITTPILTGLWEYLPKQNCESCVTASAMGFVQAGLRPIIVSEGTNYWKEAQKARFQNSRKIKNEAADIEIVEIAELLQRISCGHLKNTHNPAGIAIR